ncbi:hypothetical protein [Rhodococcus sp. NPDC049939]|uniref:hypothetical protein n=1 Tax=Rhodococcus sp. NPDC049939 TaxID=3155511 RepID=UPI0033EC86EE
MPEPSVSFPLRHVTTPNPTELQHKHWRELDAELPSVCVVHGAPGTWTFKLYLSSHPYVPYDDLSLPRKILHDFLRPSARRKRSEYRRSRKIWVKTRWPGCSACRQYRRERRALSLVLVSLTAYLITGPISPLTEWMPADLRSSLHLFGFFLIVPAAKSLGSRLDLSRATVPENGTDLVVRNPHTDFAREALTLGARQQSERVSPPGWWKRSALR